jgi:putative oxidoreductase
MKNILFPQHYHGAAFSRLLLGMRILFGVLFMTHGYIKLMEFEVLSLTFPDLIGIGAELSLVLVIFAEFFCAMGFIAGFLFRLTLLPMIFAMGVAFFMAHGGSIVNGELALIYLIVFLMMLLAGPGRYSVDNLIHFITCDEPVCEWKI